VNGGRGVLVALATLAACATTTPARRPHLDASGTLLSALPSEVRLALEDYQDPTRGRMLAISLRVAHSASQSLDGLILISATGQIAVGDVRARRAFLIVPWASKRLPGRLQLAWVGKRPDGTDKQPAYYEYAFEPAPIEGLPVGAHYIGRPIYKYPLFADHSAFEHKRDQHPYSRVDYTKVKCPTAEAILETCVILQVNEAYSDADLDDTVKAFERVVAYYQSKR